MAVKRWLILAIVVGQLAGIARVGAASPPAAPTHEVALVQLSLRVLGYDPGLIDGLSGPRTVAALAAFARDRQMVLNQATADLVITLLTVEVLEALRYAEQGKEQLPVQGPRKLPVGWW